MKCGSPSDFYERLTAREKCSIDKWKEQRDALLQTRIRKEVETVIECDSSLMRESTPFVRVLVKTFNRNLPTADDRDESEPGSVSSPPESESALLTVWRCTEEQLGVLKEGSMIRVRNLAVRKTKRDGLIQLTASQKTPMESLPLNACSRDLKGMGFHRRSFLSLFHVHALSKKLLNQSLAPFPAPEVDVAGIVLKVLEEGYSTGVRFLIYIADESGLVLRVHRDEGHRESDALRSLSTSAQRNVEHAVTIAFRDIRVMPFDPSENCAVAVFADTSSVPSRNATCGRKSDLQQWCKSPVGGQLLSRLSACVDGLVPMLQESTSKSATAVGYIAGFTVQSESSLSSESEFAPLQIMVDCGCNELQLWEFPLSLLDEALRLCGDSNDAVAVKLEEERIHLQLKYLGQVFRGSGVLLHFVLNQKPTNMQLDCNNCSSGGSVYQVQQVRVANIRALAEIYSSSLKPTHENNSRTKTRKVAIP